MDEGLSEHQTAHSRSSDRFAESAIALDHAHALAREFVANLATRPVGHQSSPEEMAAALDEALPEAGIAAGATVDEWFRRAESGIVASSGPRFFGWVFGGATPAALAGDWLASAIDQNAVFWDASPAAAQTELTVLRWLKELFGLPPAWPGAITSGATMSNVVALAAARQWAGKLLGFDPARDGLGGKPPIPIVSSTEVHASDLKALGTLGLGRGSVRKVRAVAGSVDLDALEAELSTIDGPVIVIGNAGEVNTGAFDDIKALADICRQHSGGAWLHVDGAFGLYAAASPSLRHLTQGIERADSIASDAHKWLNVPYDCGFVFIRDVDSLREAFAITAEYIAPSAGAGWDPVTHVPEASRRFRALSVWCALKAYGRTGYRDLIECCCANAARFGQWVDATSGMELMAPVPLNIVCFRYTPDGFDDIATDAFNRAAVAALQRDGRVFVTGTTWNGRAAIRAAFDNWATTTHDVDILEQAVSDIGRGINPTD